MWDLVEDPNSIALLESFYNSGKPMRSSATRPVSFAV
jgi:hypothetical protein